MGLIHKGPGAQWYRVIMGLVHNETDTQRTWDTKVQGHNGIGTQRD